MRDRERELRGLLVESILYGATAHSESADDTTAWSYEAGERATRLSGVGVGRMVALQSPFLQATLVVDAQRVVTDFHVRRERSRGPEAVETCPRNPADIVEIFAKVGSLRADFARLLAPAVSEYLNGLAAVSSIPARVRYIEYAANGIPNGHAAMYTLSDELACFAEIARVAKRGDSLPRRFLRDHLVDGSEWRLRNILSIWRHNHPYWNELDQSQEAEKDVLARADFAYLRFGDCQPAIDAIERSWNNVPVEHQGFASWLSPNACQSVFETADGARHLVLSHHAYLGYTVLGTPQMYFIFSTTGASNESRVAAAHAARKRCLARGHNVPFGFFITSLSPAARETYVARIAKSKYWLDWATSALDGDDVHRAP